MQSVYLEANCVLGIATLCIFQIIFGSATAQAQSGDSMSWQDILNRAGHWGGLCFVPSSFSAFSAFLDAPQLHNRDIRGLPAPPFRSEFFLSPSHPRNSQVAFASDLREDLFEAGILRRKEERPAEVNANLLRTRTQASDNIAYTDSKIADETLRTFELALELIKCSMRDQQAFGALQLHIPVSPANSKESVVVRVRLGLPHRARPLFKKSRHNQRRNVAA